MDEHPKLLEVIMVTGQQFTVKHAAVAMYEAMNAGRRVVMTERSGSPWKIDSDGVIAWRLVDDPDVAVDNSP